MACMTGKEKKAVVTSLSVICWFSASSSHAQSSVCICLHFVGFDQIVSTHEMLPVFSTAVIQSFVRLNILV